MCLHLERFVLLAGQTPSPEPQTKCEPSATTRRSFRSYLVIGAIVFVIMLFFVLGPSSHAQSTFGSIRGTVQDASGAVIPGAKVTLHSIDENTDRSVTTDDAGNYLLENVKAGKYSMRADHDGFAETVLDNITLTARQDLRFTLQMAVATQATSVEVTAAGTEINTENATVGDSHGNAEIAQLPLNFRASTTSPLAALSSSANVQQDNVPNVRDAEQNVRAGTKMLAHITDTYFSDPHRAEIVVGNADDHRRSPEGSLLNRNSHGREARALILLSRARVAAKAISGEGYTPILLSCTSSFCLR